MAYTFLAALGHQVGDSLLDETRLDDCRRLLRSGVDIVLPTDTAPSSRAAVSDRRRPGRAAKPR